MKRRDVLVDVAAIVAARLAVTLAALALGFDHVSDDDYARVTIAQAFAHAPKLDPTGTSWLPFPFWVQGAVMMGAGRTLAVARVTSVALTAITTPLPYLAMRGAGVGRREASLGVALAALCPWSVWLGAATVPEAMAANLIAAAAIALGIPGATSRAGALCYTLAAGAACLSRYEAWPIAACLAIVLAVRGISARRAGPLVLALGVSAGPLAWMIWNAHAHDGPLHFFRRVSSYKRALGEGSTDLVDALVLYPRLLLSSAPGVAVPAIVALWLRGEVKRWAGPLACVAGALLFLAYGNVRDGAPTHHPERALLVTLHVLGPFVAASLGPRLFRVRHGSKVLALAMGVWMAFLGRALAFRAPAQAADEDRRPQISRGRELAAAGATRLSITPCAYEHYALIAAFGRPEDVTLEARPAPKATPDASCPRVERRER